MRKYALLLAAPMALTSLSTPASANEGGGQPFITAAHYRQNISLAEFQVNPRNYFRSEDAFRLITRYVGDEIGRPNLSAAEFNALIRDTTQTRVRVCAADERINTGAYANGQFFWFVRACRAGEQIVQVLVNGVWKDMFSLGCLNAVEDKTPARPPALNVYQPPAPPQRTTGIVISSTILGGQPSVAAPGVLLTTPGASYSGGSTNINVGSRARSSSTSSSGNGGCNTCAPHADY